jgi:DNA-binding NarL/FixJ family response regulator
VRVLVADDNPVVRAGMVAMLGDLDMVDEVVTAADGAAALKHASEPGIGAVFLDVRMPFLSGLEVLAGLDGSVPVVMLTHSQEPEIVREALERGARGYLVHGTFSEEDLVAALRVCSQGGLLIGPAVAHAFLPGGSPAPSGPPRELLAQLTRREVEIMSALADGLSNAAIAKTLFLSEKTVKNHLNRVYVKCGFRTRAEAVSAWHGHSPAARSPAP